MQFEGDITDDGVRWLAENEAGDEFHAEVLTPEYGSFATEDSDVLADGYDQFRHYLEMELGGYDLRPTLEVREGHLDDAVSYTVRYRLDEPRLPDGFSMKRGEVARVVGDIPRDAAAAELDAYVDGDLADALDGER